MLAQLETDPQSMDWMEKTLQSGAEVDWPPLAVTAVSTVIQTLGGAREII